MINKTFKITYDKFFALVVIIIFIYEIVRSDFNFRGLENNFLVASFCALYLIFLILHKISRGAWFQTDTEGEINETRNRLAKENFPKFYADISKFLLRVLFYASIVLILAVTAMYFWVKFKK